MIVTSEMRTLVGDLDMLEYAIAEYIAKWGEHWTGRPYLGEFGPNIAGMPTAVANMAITVIRKNLGRASGEGTAPPPADDGWIEVTPDALARACDRAHASPNAAEVGHREGFCLACAELRVAMSGEWGTAPQVSAEVDGLDKISEALFASSLAVDRQLNSSDCDELAKSAVSALRQGKSITAALASIDRGRIVAYCNPDEEHDIDAFAPGTRVRVVAADCAPPEADRG